MNLDQWKLENAINKELLKIEKQEKKMEQAAQKVKHVKWKAEIEQKIPEKVYSGLESAFCKGFSIVFNQGSGIIEKGFDKEDLKADYEIREYAVQRKGGRKELKQMKKSAGKSNSLNIALTTVEGIGLGALGIGMPDVVLFLGTLLKGIYETALNYGFDYESEREKMLILKMMKTALLTGEEWCESNAEVEALFGDETTVIHVSESDVNLQIQETASAFAVDMLLLKFIQGLPVVGILGGAANPVYYNKVLKYVRLKYQKRYLMNKKYFKV